VAASTLSFLQPGRGDCLAAAGMDQVRLQLQFLEQIDQPPPAVGGLEGDRGAWRERPRTGTSLAGSLARLRLCCWLPASSTMATWERLRCTSIPTYTPIRASFPELVRSRSLGCRAEQGTGARPT
jgi:hypothetical protein